MARELKGYALKRRMGLVPHRYDVGRSGYGVVQPGSVRQTQIDAALLAARHHPSTTAPIQARPIDIAAIRRRKNREMVATARSEVA